MYNSVFVPLLYDREDIAIVNDEESQGKEVWCSDDNKSLQVYIQKLGLYIVLLA